MAQKSSASRNQPPKALKANTPSRVSAKDVLHVIVIGLIFTALFTAVGVIISMGMGLPVASIALNPGSTSGAPTQVAVNGTPLPTDIPPTATPTEIPCEAQAWWDGINSDTAAVVDNVQALSLETKPADIQANRASLNTLKSSVEAATVPPCVEPAKNALVTAATDSDSLYGMYLTTSARDQRGRQLLKTMDSYLAATDELEKLGIQVSEDWFQKVRDFTRGDCPAKRWYIDQFIIRDYLRFFTVMGSVDIQSSSIADKQNALIEVNTLKSSMQTDSAGYPECTKTATDHFIKAMDEAVKGLNEGLNNNPSAMSAHLQAYISESGAFSSEMTRLEPSILNPQAPSI